ncbi:MAG: site-2 protease family protein [Clostridia bacterium]|nr:site-2 protease family protein [Clostridia bacterium]
MFIINIWTILIAILIFGLLIFIHEFGHYLTARAFHVTIREFAIGMGPKLFTKVSRKTGIAYSLRALPVGGFVSMVGEDEESEDENAFHRKPVWQRIIITIAGAAMNVIVGILVMSILVMTQETLASTTIAQFRETETVSTYEYGLREEDKILKVDGTRVYIANELVYEVMRKGYEPISVTIERDGEVITLDHVEFPTFTDSGVVFGNIDFYVFAEARTPVTVLKHAVFRSVSTIKMIWESLYDLVTGKYGVESVSGPVGVTEALGEAASSGISDLVYLSVVISMNLGIMNLLPLPALDGGRLLFQIIELIRRKPVNPNVEGIVHFAGFVLLMILFVVITFKDILALF